MFLQVSIVDGQIVVDTATLTVQAQPEDRQRMVVEDTQQLNSQSYAVNRTPSDRWQPEETENFYRVGFYARASDLHSSACPPASVAHLRHLFKGVRSAKCLLVPDIGPSATVAGQLQYPADLCCVISVATHLQALATFGSDFTLIASLFPGKNRRQIKNKYSKECKVRLRGWYLFCVGRR